MEQEEAREPQPADQPAAPPPAAARASRVLGRPPVAVLEPRPADLRQRPVGPGVLRARVAVAEVAGEVEAQPLGQPRRSPRPPPGGRGSAPPSPPARPGARAELPRRSGSVSSSEPRSRTATSASWSAARERSCMWTFPVATQGTPSRSASRSSQRLRARSCRQSGRCSSTRKRSRPKAAGSRRAERLGAAPSGRRAARAARRARRRARSPRGRPAPRRALERVERERGGEGLPSGRGRVSRVRLGDQPAEIAPAGRRLDQQGEVKVGRSGALGLDTVISAPDDRADAQRLARLRELHRPPDAVVVGQRQRLVAELGRRSASSSGSEAPSPKEKAEWAVQLDVARGICGDAQRPSARTSVPPGRLAEDDDAAAVGQRQLEVAAAQRLRRPPAVLDQPLLAHRLHRHRADRARAPRRAPASHLARACGQ